MLGINQTETFTDRKLFNLYEIELKASKLRSKRINELPFSSTDESSQSNNRNCFLLNTLCFVDRLKDFRFSKGLTNEKEKKSEKKSGAI
jgi:hypothetical protein